MSDLIYIISVVVILFVGGMIAGLKLEASLHRKENTMNYEVAQDKQIPQEWRVEAIEPNEGGIFVAMFSGPDAEKRAREYADWKNGR